MQHSGQPALLSRHYEATTTACDQDKIPDALTQEKRVSSHLSKNNVFSLAFLKKNECVTHVARRKVCNGVLELSVIGRIDL